MNFELTTLDHCNSVDIKNQIRDIFFLTSPRKTFETEESKEKFFEKWLSYYLDFRPDYFYLALSKGEEQIRVLAYLSVEPDSLKSKNFFADHAHYLLFEDYYEEFSAHLHINAHPLMQGLGLGSMLLTFAEKDLKIKNICGIHLITSPIARNVSFYRKNGYLKEVVRTLNDVEYLFMGKKLC